VTRPVYDPNLFKVDPNPLISCRVRVGLSCRVKIASPTSKYIEDFRMFNVKEQSVRTHVDDNLNISKFWKILDVGFVKVNWDASLNLREGIVGLRCVL